MNPESRIFGLTDAVLSLRPGSQWVWTGDSYEGLEWMDEGTVKPTLTELALEVDRLQKAYDALEYQRLRAAEYPDFKEYLDGVVKGDQEQIDAYIAACQAVKDKYPKPE